MPGRRGRIVSWPHRTMVRSGGATGWTWSTSPRPTAISMLAFFAGVNRYGSQCQRLIGPEEEQRQYRAAIEAHQAQVQTNQEAIAALEKRVLDDLSPAEKEDFTQETARLPILQKRVPRL